MDFFWPLADGQSVCCVWFHPKALGGIARYIFMVAGPEFF